MGSNKSKKPQMLLCILLIIVGLVMACGNFIPNDYIKFGVTLVSLCVGVFGAFNALGQSGNTNEETK
ncbi:MAG: hypothetical protein LBV72_17670 [Tannerella sp.]|jgi:hypothetical protein|nr:hypothetical protein [Tannerella sp.]